MVRRRLQVLTLLLALPFLVAVVRLAFLQLVPASHARHFRLSQHRVAMLLAPVRGKILARDGRVLAGNQPVHDLRFRYELLNPRRVPLAILVEEIGKAAPFPSAAEVERRILEMADPAALAAADPPAADADTEGEWLPLIAGLDRSLEGRLENALRKHPGLFAARRAAGETIEVWFHARRVAAMEITLHRLARSLAGGGSATAAYERLASAVASRLAHIEGLIEAEAEKDRKRKTPAEIIAQRRRTSRALHYLESTWLLAPDVTERTVTAIEYDPDLYPGIEIEDRLRREYPLREAAGTVTGYLGRLDEGRALEAGERAGHRAGLLDGFDGDLGVEPFAERREGRYRSTDRMGTSGLEERYEDRLRGAYGLRIVRVDKRSRPRDILEEVPPRPGEDLKSTIDADLQAALFRSLESVIVGGGLGSGTAGSAAVMSLAPEEEGALLALVSFPGVDSNRMTSGLGEYMTELDERWGGQTNGWFRDRPSRHALFPGSVFKIVIAAAAVESGRPWEGEFSPERRYPCRYEFEPVKGMHCMSENGHTPSRTVDLAEALQFSCNNYFYYAGLRHLGADLIYEWAFHFGYGRSPGADLPPSEFERGKLRPPPEVRGARATCQYAIGQVFVEATPLQVLRSVAAIALGGRLPRPYLVEPAGGLPETVPFRDPRTLPTIRDGLFRAGHAAGGTAAGTGLGLHRFAAAYKTGTAEVTVDGRTLHHAWLVGYAPIVRPRIAFVSVVEKTRLHGAEACAPVVKEILEHFARQDPAYHHEGGDHGPPPGG
jgi:penicillin-binding protein 2